MKLSVSGPPGDPLRAIQGFTDDASAWLDLCECFYVILSLSLLVGVSSVSIPVTDQAIPPHPSAFPAPLPVPSNDIHRLPGPGFAGHFPRPEPVRPRPQLISVNGVPLGHPGGPVFPHVTQGPQHSAHIPPHAVLPFGPGHPAVAERPPPADLSLFVPEEDLHTADFPSILSNAVPLHFDHHVTPVPHVGSFVHDITPIHDVTRAPHHSKQISHHVNPVAHHSPVVHHIKSVPHNVPAHVGPGPLLPNSLPLLPNSSPFHAGAVPLHNGPVLVTPSPGLHHGHEHLPHHPTNLPHHPTLIPHHTSPITHHTSPVTHHSTPIPHHTSPITHHSSTIPHHTSPITHHTGPITHHTSPIPHHTRPITRHTSPIIHKTTPIPLHTSPITHHSSPIPHHTSPITHHTNPILHHSTPLPHHSSPILPHSNPIPHHSTPLPGPHQSVPFHPPASIRNKGVRTAKSFRNILGGSDIPPFLPGAPTLDRGQYLRHKGLDRPGRSPHPATESKEE
ncbi:hypothetical protein C7M84_024921 [Penaeus vannamei]|uniref:Uncharacterized protein n=1 Tax=Penaeus vannamei TaxID=6689 RepID=A0A423TZS7_PENVA|nr:hypothetical protein C7M84_024921 [Penaeus vannamei]